MISTNNIPGITRWEQLDTHTAVATIHWKDSFIGVQIPIINLRWSDDHVWRPSQVYNGNPYTNEVESS